MPNDHKAPPPRTLIESAYARLRRDIMDCRYAPGGRLKVEHLKGTYAVSSGTLREALSLLVADSLVVSEGHRGFRVAPMSLEEIEDITRTRVLIECEALRQSIAEGDDEWEAHLVTAFHRLTRAEERRESETSFDEWEERNRDFHRALVAGCPSPWIHRLRSILYQQSERYRRLSAPFGSESSVKHASRHEVRRAAHDEHREIFEATMGRESERAMLALATHIGLSVTRIRTFGLLVPSPKQAP